MKFIIDFYIMTTIHLYIYVPTHQVYKNMFVYITKYFIEVYIRI